MGQLNYLKTNLEEFSGAASFTGSLSGEVKWYRLSYGNNHVAALGNFATSAKSVTMSFPVTGTWYDYFYGSTYTVTSTSQNITLAPGEYLLLSTRKLDDPFTGTSLVKMQPGNITLFPNPATDRVIISCDQPLGRIEIRNLSGQMVYSGDFPEKNKAEIFLGKRVPGIYLVQVMNDGKRISRKLLLY